MREGINSLPVAADYAPVPISCRGRCAALWHVGGHAGPCITGLLLSHRCLAASRFCRLRRHGIVCVPGG